LQGSGEVTMPVYAEGFTAVEAEFVVRLDGPVAAGRWTAETVAGLPKTIFAGIEIAGSPFTGINDHGPAVTVSDFGNNAGLLVGPPLPPETDLGAVEVTTELNGEIIGTATGAAIPGGVFASLAQSLSILGRRGRDVPAGSLFATGAITGVHPAVVGDIGVITYGGLDPLRVRLVPAKSGQ
jgi:2-keto-4-pentenoate hydratase